jgi:quercetin 2,3-dioxygenase
VIRRAAERFHTGFDGVDSWHCFSAGSHYDPDQLGVGPLVGVDEHLIAAGSGFGWHAHRRVDIVSVVVSGRLRHEDDGGRIRTVSAGEVLVQRAGRGIRHCEVNASVREPLRLIQMTVVSENDEADVALATPPLTSGGARFEALARPTTIDGPRWHLLIADGDWQLGTTALATGDSARGAGPAELTGSGLALLWLLPAGS